MGRSYHNVGSAGQVFTHPTGYLSGFLLPGARTDKHQIHSETLANRGWPDHKYSSHWGRSDIIVDGIQRLHTLNIVLNTTILHLNM